MPMKGEGARAPSVYITNPLYDPAELERAFKRLEEAHGTERVKRARGWASLVYEDTDLYAVERLIEFESRRGKEIIEKAAGIVKKKSGSNPKRSMGYLLGTIERLKDSGGNAGSKIQN